MKRCGDGHIREGGMRIKTFFSNADGAMPDDQGWSGSANYLITSLFLLVLELPPLERELQSPQLFTLSHGLRLPYLNALRHIIVAKP